MSRFFLTALFLLSFSVARVVAEIPKALVAGVLPDDVRIELPKDLSGYFPFSPPSTIEEWEKRAAYVRRQILVSQGLWPMPTKTPLNAVVHGKIDGGEYSVEKVYFESAPGLFVTGNLYRPKNVTGKVPGVLFAHGHWQDARLSEQSAELTRKEIATGAERFEDGGRSRFQSMCVQLARMGCVVWQWDMLSDSDSVQFARELVHRFAKQRPEMNTIENWGLHSPQAEARLQSIMGIQTWNAIRSLDFLLSLPEVDSERTAITGASGGATQTMLLAAIDPRVKLSFPAVMVSTGMQGGCTCENASLLRIRTGNVEFAALFAPKPQGMTTANDWTKEMSTKGFPELQQLYKLMGAPKNVMLQRGEHFPHNYNAVARCAFYSWLNQHFKLGLEEPVIEKDYVLLTKSQLSVWDPEHPSPAIADPDFERTLLTWFSDDAHQQLVKCLSSQDQMKNVVGAGIESIIGRSFSEAGTVDWKLTKKSDLGSCIEMSGLLKNITYHEELPVVWLYPKTWNGHAVVWLDHSGKAGLYDENGNVKTSIQRLVDQGYTVLGADLLFQGEFLADASTPIQNRIVINPREFAGYTYGYNDALFAQRVHDVLTLIAFLRTAKIGNHPKPTSVSCFGLDETGLILAAARCVSGEAVDHVALDTHGSRFGKLLDYRDPQFLPGGAKYLDVAGMLVLNAPHSMWLAGEGKQPEYIADAYRMHDHQDRLTTFDQPDTDIHAAAIDWLLFSTTSPSQ